MEDKLCGIYLITNLSNKKVYVGQSVDISNRWHNHRRNLDSGTHHNEHLQSAWNKYGADNFSFSVLELCSEASLNDREFYWIDSLDACNPLCGYNMINRGHDRSVTREETILKLRIGHEYQFVPVLQISLNGEIVARYDSASDAARSVCSTSSAILNCAKYMHGSGHSKTHRGFIWIKEEDLDLFKSEWNDSYLDAKVCSLAVNAYTYPEGSFLGRYTSCVEAAKVYGVTADVVSMCVRGTQRHSGSVTFRRSHECDGDSDIDIVVKRRKASNSRKVCSCDGSGQIIEVFDSIIEAKEKYGYNNGHISECCNGKRRSCHGLFWKYYEEVTA